MLLDVLLHLGHVQEILMETTIVIAILPSVVLTLEVVIPRRTFLVPVRLPTMANHLVDPPLLGFRLRVDRAVAVVTHIRYAVRDVPTLSLQHERQVELE